MNHDATASKRVRLYANSELVTKALTRLQAAYPKMFNLSDDELAKVRLAEYRGFFTRVHADTINELVTRVIKTRNYPPTIADLEKLLEEFDRENFDVPEAYRGSRNIWSIWYGRYYEISAVIVSEAPGSPRQNVAIERLVQLFRDRLQLPDPIVRGESESAIESAKEFKKHLRDCIDAFEYGGAEAFRDFWNSGNRLFEGQQKDQEI